MAHPVTIWTYDWVPEGPRGFVRDLRLRWACEELGTPYEIKTVSFENRSAEHFSRQPFGQVPFLDDGPIRVFESGAALLHLARKSEVLMPTDPVDAAQVEQWVFAALNSVEMVTMPWIVLTWSKLEAQPISEWLDKRLGQIETVLANTDYLVADRFTVADLLMADALRVELVRKHGDRPASEAYVERITGRPAFRKAYEDQLAHFAAADEKRDEETV